MEEEEENLMDAPDFGEQAWWQRLRLVQQPNTAELVAIYRYILTHPEEWEQRRYGTRSQCGTAYCFAGHAVIRAGLEAHWEPEHANYCSLSNPARRWPWDEAAWNLTDGRGISTAATELLGLPIYDGGLFAAGNTLAAIREIITNLTGVDPHEEGT